MRKLSRLGIFAVAVAFFFGALSVSNADAQALNEILDRMENHKNALQSLEADVMMSKYDSTLKLSDDVSGSTYYLPGKGRNATVRIDWKKPKETLVVKDSKYILYRPDLKQAITGKVSDKDKNTKTSSALDFMSMSKSELKNNFEIQKLDNAFIGKEEVWHLKLSPKTKKSYEYAEIWVDGNGMPLQAKVVERNNDSTTVRLSNVKKNIRIDAALFKLKLPKGTQMIDG
jgi:outer membrane lipoprotein-sorting protein